MIDEAGDRAREFTVCEAVPQDLDAVVALERATENAPRWPREIYWSIVCPGGHGGAREDMRRHLAVAKNAGGEIIGFAAGCVHVTLPDSAELESVAVASAARRMGAGRALCDAVIAWCRGLSAAEIGLQVRAQSTGATALYRQLGFIEVGRRRGYYSDPPDEAVVLRMNLTAS